MAEIIVSSYKGIADIPRKLYNAYEALLAFAFYWIAATILIRSLDKGISRAAHEMGHRQGKIAGRRED
jgi:hypothetical protein